MLIGGLCNASIDGSQNTVLPLVLEDEFHRIMKITISMKKQKENSLENITWSEMGKKNQTSLRGQLLYIMFADIPFSVDRLLLLNTILSLLQKVLSLQIY